MSLEGRVLSDPSVIRAASRFVVVKLDPRETVDALEHKTTRYVPEIVVLDTEQEFVAVIQARDPAGFARELDEAYEEATR